MDLVVQSSSSSLPVFFFGTNELSLLLGQIGEVFVTSFNRECCVSPFGTFLALWGLVGLLCVIIGGVLGENDFDGMILSLICGFIHLWSCMWE